MATSTQTRGRRRWPVVALRALMLLVLIAAPAHAVRRPPMPTGTKTRLHGAHAKARAGCVKAATLPTGPLQLC